MKENIFCKICNKKTDYVIDSFSRYHLKKVHDMNIKEYYDKYIKEKNEGKCLECGKKTKFRRFNSGYSKFCSSVCINKNNQVRSKISNKIKKRTEFEKQDIINKRIKTNIDLYGVEYYSKLNSVKVKKRKKMLNKDLDKYKKYFLDQDLSIERNKVGELDIHCKDCDLTFNIQKQQIRKRINNNEKICLYCNPFKIGYSTNEKELFEFIKLNYLGEIETRTKTVIKNRELDIYLPDLNLAFEFNGLYWHNELNKSKNYHLEKTELCNKKGIKLIHIYEDDWEYKQDIIKSRILNLLGKSERIYARKCQIKEVDKQLSDIFLEENHIQGRVNSKYNIGLYHNGELISLMNFGNSRFRQNKIELLRFCNKLNITVVGGASRIFKYSINTYKFKSIISYADRSWSNGELYEKLKFKFENKTVPTYYYIVNGIRENRFKYRKSQLIKYGYDKNKTEKDIMFERAIYRIYNSGNLKYTYDINT